MLSLFCVSIFGMKGRKMAHFEGGGTGTSRKFLGTRGKRKIDGDKAELIRPKKILFPVGSGHFCTFKNGRTTTYYACDYARRIYNRPLFSPFLRPLD